MNLDLVREMIAQHALEIMIILVIVIYLAYYFSRISKVSKLVIVIVVESMCSLFLLRARFQLTSALI